MTNSETVWVVPEETERVVIRWVGVDGIVHESAPVEIEQGKTYTVTVNAAHGGGGGAGLPTPNAPLPPPSAPVPETGSR